MIVSEPVNQFWITWMKYIAWIIRNFADFMGQTTCYFHADLLMYIVEVLIEFNNGKIFAEVNQYFNKSH